jgi:hypothetical protein
MDLEGGCACGSVRYRLTAPPLIVHACHCRDCLVRIGTLDHLERVEPDVHIFTRAKLPWFRLPPDKLAFEAFYKIPEVWPAASQERLRSNIAGQS